MKDLKFIAKFISILVSQFVAIFIIMFGVFTLAMIYIEKAEGKWWEIPMLFVLVLVGMGINYIIPPLAKSKRLVNRE